MWAAAGGAGVVIVSCMVLIGSTRILHLLAPPAEPARYVAAEIPQFALGSASLCAAAGLSAVASLPWPVWLPWLGFAGLGVWLACVDAVTGFVPRPVSQLTTVVVVILIGAQAATTGSAAPLVRAGVGGVVVWLLFAGLWLLARGALGFGDVRFSLPWAMTAAAASWPHLMLAALLGPVFALSFGLMVRSRGTDSFPYTPGLSVGLFAAAALLGWPQR